MQKFGAEPAIKVPTKKVIMVPTDICLVVNQPSSRGDIGMTIAIISINPVATHCAVGKVTSNSFIKVLNDILSRVSFKIAKNAPMIKATIIGKVFTLGSSDKTSYCDFLFSFVVVILHLISVKSIFICNVFIYYKVYT